MINNRRDMSTWPRCHYDVTVDDRHPEPKATRKSLNLFTSCSSFVPGSLLCPQRSPPAFFSAHVSVPFKNTKPLLVSSSHSRSRVEHDSAATSADNIPTLAPVKSQRNEHDSRRDEISRRSFLFLVRRLPPHAELKNERRTTLSL